MIQTKTIAMVLLVAIVTIGAIGIGIGTATQSVKARGGGFDRDDSNGQSFHDSNGDNHCHQVSGVPVC